MKTSWSFDLLICYVYRHRWIPFAGEAGVVDGSRVLRWELRCESCGSHAHEWRDLQGLRIPGTQRQYIMSEDYQKLLRNKPGQAQAFAQLSPAINRANRVG